MSTPTPEGLMYMILTRRDEMNRVAGDLIGIGTSEGVFKTVSLEMPKFEPPELGFLRSVSWLFVLYHEVGKTGVAFLAARLEPYGLDPEKRLNGHPSLVQKLRTFLQHNLDPRKHHDSEVQTYCQGWLKRQCGTPFPTQGDQWRSCLSGLLSEAVEFMDALSCVVRKIEQDESRSAICREWQFRIRRYHPPHEFDELIKQVAADMGRDRIDAVQLRSRFYEKWTQELSLLDGEYEFVVEARRLIEQALLTAITPVLPITGRDVMEVFEIPPGVRVGQLLERARRIYESKPCTREALIEQLRQAENSVPEDSGK
jgi:hypothetical protein